MAPIRTKTDVFNAPLAHASYNIQMGEKGKERKKKVDSKKKRKGIGLDPRTAT